MTRDAVRLSDGRELPSTVAVWTAGFGALLANHANVLPGLRGGLAIAAALVFTAAAANLLTSGAPRRHAG